MVANKKKENQIVDNTPVRRDEVKDTANDIEKQILHRRFKTTYIKNKLLTRNFMRHCEKGLPQIT